MPLHKANATHTGLVDVTRQHLDMYTQPAACVPMGGHGLVGTAHDYLLFCRMLLGRGPAGCSGGPGCCSFSPNTAMAMCCTVGALASRPARLLSPATVDAMLRNQLPPPHRDLADLARPQYSEVPLRGAGFGYGVAINHDPVRPALLSFGVGFAAALSGTRIALL